MFVRLVVFVNSTSDTRGNVVYYIKPEDIDTIFEYPTFIRLHSKTSGMYFNMTIDEFKKIARYLVMNVQENTYDTI